MTVEFFMIVITAISVITGLVVEALKKIIKSDAYNVIAGIVAIVISIVAAIMYAVWNAAPVDAKYIIFFICVAFASWLSAMIGFDKVRQAILQIGSAP